MARRGGVVAAIVRGQREAQRRESARQRAAAQATAALEREAEKAARAEQKAIAVTRKEQERERDRLYLESRLTEVAENNHRLKERVRELDTILSCALDRDITFSLDSLRPELRLPSFDAQGLDKGEPPPRQQDYFRATSPPLVAKLWPGKLKTFERELADALARYETATVAHAAREAERLTNLAEARDHHHRAVFAAEEWFEAQNRAIDDLKQRLAEGDPQAVVEYFLSVLEASPYPDGFPTFAKVAFVQASRQLVVEKNLPDLHVVPDADLYKYIKARDEITTVPRQAAERRTLYASVVAQTTLKTLYELFNADRTGHVESVVLNGYVEAIDPGFGGRVRPCLVTVRITRDMFDRLNLRNVEPLACLKVINAGISHSPAELLPVRPVLEFSMVDPRFVEESDVLSTLDQRANLMELSPGEFEALITNLFERMGLETRLTQASRDGGVDCVTYDPRPIFGGKVIIQAKRYKHTVGVSAVRDLFGTLQNEGASKGILVTTSGYGKASFDFANGKPLELLSGEHLLYLLKEHADLDAKIEVPESWRDPSPDIGGS